MKQAIRDSIKAIIKNIPSDKKEEYSFCITQKIIEKFGHLDTRHIYQSMDDEVDTTQLIKRLQENNKKIFLAPINDDCRGHTDGITRHPHGGNYILRLTLERKYV